MKKLACASALLLVGLMMPVSASADTAQAGDGQGQPTTAVEASLAQSAIPIDATVVPEPKSAAVLVVAMAGLSARRRRV